MWRLKVRFSLVATVALVLGVLATCSLAHRSALAGTVNLKNGVQLEGRLGYIARIGENPNDAGGTQVRQIVLVDDDLRRAFVSSMQTRTVAEGAPVLMEKMQIDQRVAGGNRRLGAVGPIIRITPFDQWGRRIFSMRGPNGRIDLVQGITEITPHYTKIEGLSGRSPYIWDMRIATSSIPRQTLSSIMLSQMDPKNPDHRLKVVRLYIQAERYSDAQRELEGIKADFPDIADLKSLTKQIEAIQQFNARRIIKEIELRMDAGQYALALRMLDSFPNKKEIAGETVLKIRDMRNELKRKLDLRDNALAQIDTNLKALADAELRAKVQPVRDELAAELNIDNLVRLNDFVRLAESDKHGPDQKLALAVSGWVLGSGSGTENLAVALSVYEVRKLVSAYLSAETIHDREEIMKEIKTHEGSAPSYLAKILAIMKPPTATQAQEILPGMYTLTTPGLAGEPDITYHIQLPPEYDPHRKYPCIVALNGAGVTPEQELDWWAGRYSEQHQIRLGQASRRGYVVIAPVWSREHQTKYQFTAREHAAVLYSLRDACKRVSINTDRVFLSGHSMGGDAAWDIALAHPDVWAGAIPIVATADKYIARYWENGEYVPLYFVMGEMDGDRMSNNSREFDRYLTHRNFDTMIVEYQGRGHEHFSDEIQQLFDWMEKHERNFHRREFTTYTMRPWDNFFWWVEVSDLPERSVTAPLSWPPEAGVRPAKIAAKVLEVNGVLVNAGAGKTTIYFSPEIVSFEERIRINGRSEEITPTAEVMLEDVRTRSDRQHPFWAKFEIEGRRR